MEMLGIGIKHSLISMESRILQEKVDRLEDYKVLGSNPSSTIST
jgi:hypothetical protein